MAQRAYAKLQGKDFALLVKQLPCVLGRGPSATVEIPGSTVSRRHAVVEWNDNHYVLKVEGRNGVIVNGAFYPCGADPVQLESGAAIRLGSACFYFLLPLALVKPKQSYRVLCADVLRNATAPMSVADICTAIADKFMFFKQPVHFKRLKLGIRGIVTKTGSEFVVDKTGPVHVFSMSKTSPAQLPLRKRPAPTATPQGATPTASKRPRVLPSHAAPLSSASASSGAPSGSMPASSGADTSGSAPAASSAAPSSAPAPSSHTDGGGHTASSASAEGDVTSAA